VRWNLALRYHRYLLRTLVLSSWLVALLIMPSFKAGATEVTFRQYRTAVTPESGETLQDRCYYQLLLPIANRPVRSVFVIFERGWQVGNLYYDHAIVDFAAGHQMGLLLAQHCRSKEREDMDVVPEHGIGRALFTALKQFALASDHPEIAQSVLIFFSFSGGGSLVARMAGFAPDRTLALIASAPGQYEPLGMDTIDLPKNALAVPQLIIANGADKVNGTARPYLYFQQYRKQGAPLTFVIQNRAPHCCVSNVIQLMLVWLDAVVRQRQPISSESALRTIDQNQDWLGWLKVEDSGVKDHWQTKSWNVSSAEAKPFEGKTADALASGIFLPNTADEGVPSVGELATSWLPSKAFATVWLAFENQKEHPITPLE
jgi:dienelactone hydrolase